jgi:type I restriction enzyme S subunit
MKRIGDILSRNKTPVVVEGGTSYKQVTIRTNYKGVVLRGSQNGSSIGTKNQSAVSAGQFILSRIDARNGAFGIVPEELEGAIVTNDFLAFDINEEKVEREFFNVFLQAPQFLHYCNDESTTPGRSFTAQNPEREARVAAQPAKVCSCARCCGAPSGWICPSATPPMRASWPW